ncbi:MAG TPA: thioredoxin domain-containing protein [Chthoniobacterales bacterium]
MNRLASEQSPYLLQHANNPVDWFAWGEEAFAAARATDKPIFLSIGYSTCHWCHVMERESFETEAIARLLNENFISIKVDREERPDVDRIYMAFVQATTGSGGWPMSVWLTPDLKPFVGGTYFPPHDKYGRAGFPTVLLRIAETWKKNRSGVLERGEEILSALREQASSTPTAARLDPSWIQRGFEINAESFDADWGGFGGAPKFPRPVTLNLQLRCSIRSDFSPERQVMALRMTRETLRHMARGGMHDHLGGGFHRYSVDRYWHVPHFEKMLYDQAQLAVAYVEHWQRTSGGDSGSAFIAHDILDYVERDMRHPNGGFYSAEDADSLFEHGKPEHGEGAFYVWSKEEIENLLGAEDAALFNRFYGVEANGNAPEESDPQGEFTGKNVLIQRLGVTRIAEQTGLNKKDIMRRLEAAGKILLVARNKRPRPHLDDKIITAWNGLMISAFARAGAALGEPKYVDIATQAADFLRKNLTMPDGNLIRSFRKTASNVPGFTDDYAFLVQGLLDLYEATFDRQWLDWAVDLQKKQDALFLDAENGGYFSTRAGDSELIVRLKEDYDGAEPSANSISANNLLRLSAMLDRPDLRDQCGKLLLAFAGTMERTPHAVPQMLVAVDRYLEPPQQIVLAGDVASPAFQSLAREVHRRFLPRTVVIAADSSTHEMPPQNGLPTAYVCENFVCKLPVTAPDDLARLISGPTNHSN